jgi:AraC-like DNA-binding protein
VKGTAVTLSGGRSSSPARSRSFEDAIETEVVAVPVLSLRSGDSPRLNGQDKAHIARLIETEATLPPILVDRRTMRVIDGMHRLMAASIQGRATIDVVFFDGDQLDVFLLAVRENIRHGLPLSQADRRAATERIVASHPHVSDRTIAQLAGMATKTVATIRRRSSGMLPQSNTRVGKDGRVRPLDSWEGRQRAAELLTGQPGASLRDVALAAGIAPSTVLDVRKRLDRGEPPTPGKPSSRVADDGAEADQDAPQPNPPRSRPLKLSRAAQDPAGTVQKLLRDPSLRSNEHGKVMLRLLNVNAAGAEQLHGAAATLPPHCVAVVVDLARQYAKMWQDFAGELDDRARIIDPSAALTPPRAAVAREIPPSNQLIPCGDHHHQ